MIEKCWETTLDLIMIRELWIAPEKLGVYEKEYPMGCWVRMAPEQIILDVQPMTRYEAESRGLRRVELPEPKCEHTARMQSVPGTPFVQCSGCKEYL